MRSIEDLENKTFVRHLAREIEPSVLCADKVRIDVLEVTTVSATKFQGYSNTTSLYLSLSSSHSLVKNALLPDPLPSSFALSLLKTSPLPEPLYSCHTEHCPQYSHHLVLWSLLPVADDNTTVKVHSYKFHVPCLGTRLEDRAYRTCFTHQGPVRVWDSSLLLTYMR